METMTLLGQGFSVTLTPQNLMLAVAGCILGTIIGALPRLGPSNGVAILIPLAFSLGLDATAALVLMTSVYYGAMYGGRISSILLNIPGDEPALMTTLDGQSRPCSRCACAFRRGLVCGNSSGTPRLSFDSLYLYDGVNFLVAIVGLFAVTEVFVFIETSGKNTAIGVKIDKITIPWRDIIRTSGTMLRGTVIGFVAGILPGAGASLGSFLAYSAEKTIAKDKSQFGKGGVVAPEAGNNAAAGGALGFFLRKLDIPTVPIILGILLGSHMENALQRAMVISGGEWQYLFSSKIAIGLWVAAVVGFIAPMFLRRFLKKPEVVPDECQHVFSYPPACSGLALAVRRWRAVWPPSQISSALTAAPPIADPTILAPAPVNMPVPPAKPESGAALQ